MNLERYTDETIEEEIDGKLITTSLVSSSIVKAGKFRVNDQTILDPKDEKTLQAIHSILDNRFEETETQDI